MRIIGAALALSLAPACCLAQQAISSSPAVWLHSTVVSGHPEFEITGLVPTLQSNCGTGAKIAGNDVVGRIIVGSNPGSACSLMFASNPPWPNPPVCGVWDETSGAAVFPQPQTTNLVIVGNFAAGDALSYGCMTFTTPPSVSPDGTILLSGAPGSLVTTAGTWTFGSVTDVKGGHEVLLGNAPPLSPAWYGQQMEVNHGGILYLQGDSGAWYRWSGSAFVSSAAP